MQELFKEMAECKSEIRSLKSIVSILEWLSPTEKSMNSILGFVWKSFQTSLII